MSGWMPRVKGYSAGWPRRCSSPSRTSLSSYSCSISMPESVNFRGSSGPTIGAIEGLLSRWVAMAPEDIRRLSAPGRSAPALECGQDSHPVRVATIADREPGGVADRRRGEHGDEQAGRSEGGTQAGQE